MKKRGRGGGGSDEEGNVISLCDAHHNGYAGVKGWHSFPNPTQWFKVYNARLGPEDYNKVGRFLAIFVEPALKSAPKGALAEFEATSAKLQKQKRCPWCGGTALKGSKFCARRQCERAWTFQHETLSKQSA